jgi:ketopantoate reductase
LVPLLDSVDHIGRLREHYGAERVLPGSIRVEAEQAGPRRVRHLSAFADVYAAPNACFAKEPATRNLRALDPNLTLTRTQYPAIVGNRGNKKLLTYAEFARLCNIQQPLTAHS